MMLSFLTSLVFPNHCLLCEDLLRPEEQSVCQICLAAQPRCSFLEHQRLERISSTIEAHFSAVLINCPSVSTLCHNLKYGGHPRMARHLGYHFLGRAIASAHSNIVLVPMPVSKRRRRRRGYNQSEGLAQGCLKKLSESGYRATVVLLLEKHAHRKSQIEVDPFERWTNPRGSLRVRQKIKQRIPRDALLVLIDDTVTTGSTLLYAAEVVREAFPEQPLHLLALALEV